LWNRSHTSYFETFGMRYHSRHEIHDLFYCTKGSFESVIEVHFLQGTIEPQSVFAQVLHYQAIVLARIPAAHG
jgi:hypothetical protein